MTADRRLFVAMPPTTADSRSNKFVKIPIRWSTNVREGSFVDGDNEDLRSRSSIIDICCFASSQTDGHIRCVSLKARTIDILLNLLITRKWR